MFFEYDTFGPGAFFACAALASVPGKYVIERL